MADSDIVGSASLRINVDTSGVESQILTGARAAAARAEARLAQQQERAHIRLGQLQARAQREDATRTAQITRNAERQVAANNRITKSLEDQNRAALRTGAIFASIAATGFGLLFRKATELRAEFERSQVAFAGLLGESDAVKGGFETTAEAVQGLTADLQILSIKSGADINDLSRGTQALITGLNLSRGAAVGLVEDVAAAAAASGAALDSIPRAIRAITQISSKGFLSAEELNQIADVLPVVSRTDIYENLAEALKLPIAEIQKLANEGGRITAAQGLPALIKVLQDVEGASDALDRQLQTLPGALNVLRQTTRIVVQEGFNEASVAIRGFVNELGGIEGTRDVLGDLFEPFDQISADVVRALGDSFRALAPVLADLGSEFAEFFGAVVGILPSLAELSTGFLRVLTAALQVINALGPLQDILGALVASFLTLRSIQIVAQLLVVLTGTLRGLAGTSIAATGSMSALSVALTAVRTTGLSAATALGVLKAAAGPLVIAVSAIAGAMALVQGQTRNTGEEVAKFNDEVARTSLDEAFGKFANVNLDEFSEEIATAAENLRALTGAEAVDLSGLESVNNVLSRFKEIVDAGQIATARSIINDERLVGVRSQLTRILEEGEAALVNHARGVDRDREAVEELINPTNAAADAIKRFGEALKESTSQIQAVLSADERLGDAKQRVADAIDKAREAEEALAELRLDLASLAAEQLIALDEKRVQLAEDLAQAEEDVLQSERALEDARRGLEDATEGIADAEERLADAQAELNALFEPATERELAAARRDVLRAENSLADATERRVEAEEALAAFERRRQNSGARLNVIGLDLLRTNLANARANAAALRQLPDEDALRDDLTDAILDEAEAKERVVDATEELAELERKGIPTAEELAEARRNIERAERDVARARQDEVRATEDLATAERDLVTSQTAVTQARDIEAGLAPLRKQQLEETRNLTNQVADAEDRVDSATRSVTDARNQSAIASNALTASLRLLNGEQDAEIRNLFDLVALYGELGLVAPASLQAIRTELSAFSPAGAVGSILDALVSALEIVPGVSGKLKLKKRPGSGGFLSNFLPFEQGGLITQPTMAMMGEKGLKELVLPLTKPARAIQLAQQHGFVDMLSRHNQAMFPSTALSRPTPAATLTRGTSGPGAIHDPLLAEIRTLNSLLASGNLGSDDIDINIAAPTTGNERLRARQMGRQIEKALKRRR